MTENPQNLNREAQVAAMIENIHQRLRRSRGLKDLTGTPQTSVGEQCFRDMFGANITNIARSEFSITPEQLGLFNTKIEEARTVLFEKGQTGTELWLEGGIPTPYEGLTEDEMKNFYQLYNQTKSKMATGYKEKEPVYKSDNSCARLLFSVDEDNLGIQLNLDLEGRYSLEIDFSKTGSSGYEEEYHSGRKSLDQMTPEEYEIATFYLDKFMAEANRGETHDS